jgi:Putative DNA-binding domain
LLLLPLDRINEEFLKQICKDKCPESQTLEFKRDLPGSSDKDKHELCKDVSALANTDGGDLVYGIHEVDSMADSIRPITGEKWDDADLRVRSVLDARVDLRIHGIKIQRVDVAGGFVMIIRVPSSFDGPHCVRNDSNRKFFMRNGPMVNDMSFDQLRGAFGRTATLAERANLFITNRLEVITARKTKVRIFNKPNWVIHLVPISSMAGRTNVNLSSVYANTPRELMGENQDYNYRSLNIDGLTHHTGDEANEGCEAYNCVFRSGVLEGAEQGGGTVQRTGQIPYQGIYAVQTSKYFHSSLKRFLGAATSLGITGPAVLSLAIVNVEGFTLALDRGFHRERGVPADRPHLVAPSQWIEDIEAVKVDEILRPLLDSLWQGFGLPSCTDFDPTTGAFKLNSN